jgi:hypothetical protein
VPERRARPYPIGLNGTERAARPEPLPLSREAPPPTCRGPRELVRADGGMPLGSPAAPPTFGGPNLSRNRQTGPRGRFVTILSQAAFKRVAHGGGRPP